MHLRGARHIIYRFLKLHSQQRRKTIEHDICAMKLKYRTGDFLLMSFSRCWPRQPKQEYETTRKETFLYVPWDARSRRPLKAIGNFLLSTLEMKIEFRVILVFSLLSRFIDCFVCSSSICALTNSCDEKMTTAILSKRQPAPNGYGRPLPLFACSPVCLFLSFLFVNGGWSDFEIWHWPDQSSVDQSCLCRRSTWERSEWSKASLLGRNETIAMLVVGLFFHKIYSVLVPYMPPKRPQGASGLSPLIFGKQHQHTFVASTQGIGMMDFLSVEKPTLEERKRINRALSWWWLRTPCALGRTTIGCCFIDHSRNDFVLSSDCALMHEIHRS